MEATIKGLIEHVTFHNPDTGFVVLKVKPVGQFGQITVIGQAPSAGPGEWVKAGGRWVMDRQHGRQFRAKSLEVTPPDSAEGVLRYLSSGMVRGIGPAFAQRLVDAFGTQLFDVIEHEPKRLRHVDGIGPKRAESIVSSFGEQKAVRDIMVFLHSHGVSTARAFRIYKTYGNQAVDAIVENPYRLARDIWGIGFKSADQIAERLGIARDSPLRAAAGLAHALHQLGQNGHCAFERAELICHTARLLDIDDAVVVQALNEAIQQNELVLYQTYRGTLIYLPSMDSAERSVAKHVVRLALGRHPCPRIDMGKAFAWVQQRLGFHLAQEQVDAVSKALQNKFMIITGGPGVGKTTVQRAILDIMKAKKLKVQLCAPTGRAAKRLGEACGQEAKTIHRMLKFDPATHSFRYNAEAPLVADAVIVDEVSMLDLQLANHLLAAVPDRAAVLFVGDADQLPSVGPGNVLGDLIDSGLIPICRMNVVHRQAAESAIVTNAHRVNRGDLPLVTRAEDKDSPESDFFSIDCDDPERAVNLILKMVRVRIPAVFSLDPVQDVQVLTPMQRGVLGARNLNQVLQDALRPEGPVVERFGNQFGPGDKVMQVLNDYDKDVFNGDIGRVTEVDGENRFLNVSFDGRVVPYRFEELDGLVLAYAVTIHKSQGSEYPCVIIPLHTQHYTMLQRNLLYTGLTRGRRLVVLISSNKALRLAVSRRQGNTRVTSLKERILAEHGARSRPAEFA